MNCMCELLISYCVMLTATLKFIQTCLLKGYLTLSIYIYHWNSDI